MSDRVTNADLEAACKRINRTVNGTDETPLWRRIHDLEEAPINVASIGVYYVDGAYGGVALYRITSEGGGCTDVFNVGHVPKRELRNLMFAYLEGIDAERIATVTRGNNRATVSA